MTQEQFAQISEKITAKAIISLKTNFNVTHAKQLFHKIYRGNFNHENKRNAVELKFFENMAGGLIIVYSITYPEIHRAVFSNDLEKFKTQFDLL